MVAVLVLSRGGRIMKFVYVVMFISYPGKRKTESNIEKVFESREHAIRYAETRRNHFVHEWKVYTEVE